MHFLTQAKLSSDLLFTEEELDILQKTEHEKANDIILKYANSVSQKKLQQIVSRVKAKDKLPFLFQNTNIVYPPSLNLEQSSSEITAKFKASLCHGKKFIDLCCGFGIDSYFLAQNFSEGILVEKNEKLANITSHNFALLNQNNIQFATGIDAVNFLQWFHENVDMVYIDPSRRDRSGNKVISLTDCEPDVVTLIPNILNISNRLLIKTSPLLDIQLTCSQLQNVKHVYILSVDNECKELLFDIEKDFDGEMLIHAVQLSKNEVHSFEFTIEAEKNQQVNYSMVKQYLYEPDAAILKSGGFKSVANSYQLFKLHQHSHLYTSDTLLDNFPGRAFEIKNICKVDKRILHQILPSGKANLSLRNFPGKTHDLQKKLGIKDGGAYYVFATTDCEENKRLIITTKATVL